MIPLSDGRVETVLCCLCDRWNRWTECNRCTRFIHKDNVLVPSPLRVSYYNDDKLYGYNKIVCADFKPTTDWSGDYLREAWTTFDEYYAQKKEMYDKLRPRGVPVCLHYDFKTSYVVSQDQFVFGPMLDEDGFLHYQDAVTIADDGKGLMSFGPGKIQVLGKEVAP